MKKPSARARNDDATKHCGHRRPRRPIARPRAPATYTLMDLCWALDNAAEFLENEAFPHDDGEQEAANKDGARRIRRMVKRLEKRLKTAP